MGIGPHSSCDLVSLGVITLVSAGISGLQYVLLKYTVSQKKGATLTMGITLSILGGFANSFTAGKTSKFTTKPMKGYPPHLK